MLNETVDSAHPLSFLQCQFAEYTSPLSETVDYTQLGTTVTTRFQRINTQMPSRTK